MTALRTSIPDASHRRPAGETVLVDGGAERGFVVVDRRLRDTIAARVRATALDRRLAAGEPPESGRLLAVRAAFITTPEARARLARQWEALEARARRPIWVGRTAVPIARGRIDTATDHLQRVVELLRSDRPVAAAGVAAAGLLLSSGDSPAFSVLRNGDLLAALGRTVAALRSFD